MEKLTLEVPAMYGDHHVIEVRRILLETPGVEDVYASSAFHAVEVGYDPAKVNDVEIKMKLNQAGYLGEWTVTTEPTPDAAKNGKPTFMRHTAVYEQTRQTVSFAQNTEQSARPLWPCPGMGPIRGMDEE